MRTTDDAFEQYRMKLRRNYVQLLMLAAAESPLARAVATSGAAMGGDQFGFEQPAGK